MLKKLFGSEPRSSLLRDAFGEITAMLKQGGQMLDLALAALLENQPLEADLEEMDDRVDEGERRVRRYVLEHLSVDPRRDLVASLILVSMVQDAERIGDFARGLAELLELTERPRGGHWAEKLRALADRVRPLFELTDRAFSEDDAELARRVGSAHVELKETLQAYVREVAASDLPRDLAILYALAARILRRISAHLSNIASTVVQPYDRIRHGDEEV